MHYKSHKKVVLQIELMRIPFLFLPVYQLLSKINQTIRTTFLFSRLLLHILAPKFKIRVLHYTF
jgi:hypothetical protein